MNIMIIGATSAIAVEAARIYAMRKDHLFLVARDEQKLESVKADLIARGATSVTTAVMDAVDFDRHQEIIDSANDALGSIDVALIAHGTTPDQKACESDVNLARHEIDVNGTSVISLSTLLATAMQKQSYGTLAVISSVAGDRGRQSNYVYGAAKGMVSLFLAGLRNRLSSEGVHVVTIKPGFVDTPLTDGFDKSGFLWATAHQVGEGIVKAIDKKRNEVYLPWFWWGIMQIIKNIPEMIFKRLNL